MQSQVVMYSRIMFIPHIIRPGLVAEQTVGRAPWCILVSLSLSEFAFSLPLPRTFSPCVPMSLDIGIELESLSGSPSCGYTGPAQFARSASDGSSGCRYQCRGTTRALIDKDWAVMV